MEKLIIVKYVIKVILHYLYVLCTPFLEHHYDLSFTKESNGCWYIDMPVWFEGFHENLMMVAGADKLCDVFDDGTGNAKVHVITSNKDLYAKYYNNSIVCEREWAELRWGGQYKVIYCGLNENYNIQSMWLCQVTLFVLGWWPKHIYIQNNG